MRQFSHSSGDLLVDRRAGIAETLARTQDFAGAAEIMADALALAPHWVAGWKLLGDYRSSAGDDAGALAAYRKVEELDANSAFGTALALAAHGGGDMPGTDVAYVEALFDEYAGRFEHELVEALGYGIPPVLGQVIRGLLGGRRVARAVDLGCGTGLVGVEIRNVCERLEGVDLSAQMLAEARRKGIYDALVQGELVAFLSADAGGIGLLTAADVVNYCGPLPPVLAPAFNAMAPGGLFGFSLELHEGAGTLLQRRQLRYAHNADEAIADCRAAGFEVATTLRTPIRNERGVPVDGMVVVVVRRPVG